MGIEAESIRNAKLEEAGISAMSALERMDDIYPTVCDDHSEIINIARACAERLTHDELVQLAHDVLGLLVGRLP